MKLQDPIIMFEKILHKNQTHGVFGCSNEYSVEDWLAVCLKENYLPTWKTHTGKCCHVWGVIKDSELYIKCELPHFSAPNLITAAHDSFNTNPPKHVINHLLRPHSLKSNTYRVHNQIKPGERFISREMFLIIWKTCLRFTHSRAHFSLRKWNPVSSSMVTGKVKSTFQDNDNHW